MLNSNVLFLLIKIRSMFFKVSICSFPVAGTWILSGFRVVVFFFC